MIKTVAEKSRGLAVLVEFCVNMSDYYDDSFESESDSDSGEKEEADHGEASNSVQNPSFTTRDIHLAPSLLTNPRLSAALRGSGSGSDLEEHEFSRFRPT